MNKIPLIPASNWRLKPAIGTRERLIIQHFDAERPSFIWSRLNLHDQTYFELAGASRNSYSCSELSPDGVLFFVDETGIRALNTRTNESRQHCLLDDENIEIVKLWVRANNRVIFLSRKRAIPQSKMHEEVLAGRVVTIRADDLCSIFTVDESNPKPRLVYEMRLAVPALDMSPDGRFLYVASQRLVSQIDLSGGNKTDIAELPDTPYGIALSPRQTLIAWSTHDSDLVELDLSKKETRTIGMGAMPCFLSKTDQLAFFGRDGLWLVEGRNDLRKIFTVAAGQTLMPRIGDVRTDCCACGKHLATRIATGPAERPQWHLILADTEEETLSAIPVHAVDFHWEP
ncbi:MAG: hypothetical protein PHS14_12670 [Elusimicrobia bacterium]|nr:hypothetical protein [Elusimicrobiota bacterium]